MKKNFDLPTKSPNGEDLKNEKGGIFGMSFFIAQALNIPEQSGDQSKTLEIYNVAKRVAKGGEQDYSTDDLSLIKKKLLEAKFSPSVFGAIHEYIEQDAEKGDV